MKRTAIGSVLAAASAVLTATAHAEFAPTTLQTGAGDPAIELVRLGTYEGNLSDGQCLPQPSPPCRNCSLSHCLQLHGFNIARVKLWAIWLS